EPARRSNDIERKRSRSVLFGPRTTRLGAAGENGRPFGSAWALRRMDFHVRRTRAISQHAGGGGGEPSCRGLQGTTSSELFRDGSKIWLWLHINLCGFRIGCLWSHPHGCEPSSCSGCSVCRPDICGQRGRSIRGSCAVGAPPGSKR